MPNAIFKALNTPEILEAILLQFSDSQRAELLLSQRVCRFWCDVIANSPALQVKLYFQASGRPAATPTINPLLHRLIPTESSISIGSTTRCIRDWYTVQSQGRRLILVCTQQWGGHDFYVYITIIGNMTSKTTASSITDVRNGSWEHMLISDPACPVHLVDVELTYGFDLVRDKNHFHFGDLVKIGELLQSLKTWRTVSGDWV